LAEASSSFGDVAQSQPGTSLNYQDSLKYFKQIEEILTDAFKKSEMNEIFDDINENKESYSDEYNEIFDCFDTPFLVGRHDEVCGLPIDEDLKNNQDYLEGRKQGKKDMEDFPIAIYLDDANEDERPTPEGWVRCRWPEDVIALLKKGNVKEISLDHDLGEFGNDARTGYDVLLWIEEQVAMEGFKPPDIDIHTANPSAERKMWQAAHKIYELAERNKDG